jgi:hypothetical protein
MKHHEPQDWKLGAIPGQGRGGANRQGGARPRRRHTRRVGDLSPKRSRRRARGTWTPRLARQWRGDLWKLERDDRTASQRGGFAGNLRGHRRASPAWQDPRSDPQARSERRRRRRARREPGSSGKRSTRGRGTGLLQRSPAPPGGATVKARGIPKATTVQAKANEPEASPVQLPRAAADASRS